MARKDMMFKYGEDEDSLFPEMLKTAEGKRSGMIARLFAIHRLARGKRLKAGSLAEAVETGAKTGKKGSVDPGFRAPTMDEIDEMITPGSSLKKVANQRPR